MSNMRSPASRFTCEEWEKFARGPQPVAQNLLETEKQICRYPKRYHRRLRRLAAGSTRNADLLFSFPAACISLVTDRGSPAARGEALWLIRTGSPRGLIAKELQIPQWMWKLSPKFFSADLPENLCDNDQEKAFGRRLVNFLPDETRDQGRWLRRVFEARQYCDDEFAIWIAAKALVLDDRLLVKHLPSLAAYAWYSRHQEHEAADLIGALWRPGMGIPRALCETYSWLIQILLDICGDHQARSGIWARSRMIGNMLIVPLLTTKALMQTGTIMNNCVPVYAGRILRGASHMYTLLHDGAHIANMEVLCDAGSSEKWQISEIRGYENSAPTLDAIKSAYDWLELQNEDWGSKGACGSLPIDQDFWTMLWEPYWHAKGSFGILTPDVTPCEIEHHMKTMEAVCQAHRA